jgi:hypothetical protein
LTVVPRRDAPPTKEIEALARAIARPDTHPEIVECARHVARARLDVARVRYARHLVLLEVLCPTARDQAEAQSDVAGAEAARAFADRLIDRVKTLRALDRYERAARARRRFANYALDAARWRQADARAQQATHK